jgi:hypothetical protein
MSEWINFLNDTRTLTSDILTSLADHGELILQAMRPGMDPGLGTVVWVAQWIAYGTLIVNGLLGADRAAQFESSVKYGAKRSEAHPLPEGVEESLIGYWHSVSWRLDQLREWAGQP